MPCTALGSVAGVIMIVGTLTTSVRVAVPVCPLASRTVTVNGKLPEAVGVPESRPVADSVTVGGNVPPLSVKLYGATAPEPASATL